jgi:hypothetical protein
VAKFCVALLLIVSIGAHWACLQSIAWMGMLIDYSRGASLAVAVCKTFDGQHPCCLCKAIADGKKSEQKKDRPFQTEKLEFPLFDTGLAICFPARPPLRTTPDLTAKAAFQEPSIPPPRNPLA